MHSLFFVEINGLILWSTNICHAYVVDTNTKESAYILAEQESCELEGLHVIVTK